MKKLSGIELSRPAMAVVGVVALGVLGFFAFTSLREPDLPKATKMPDWTTINKSVKRQPPGFKGN